MKAWLEKNKAYILFAALLACFGIGFWVGNSIAAADTAKQAKDFATQKQAAVEAVLEKLISAQSGEREALNRLAAKEAERKKLALEKDREIRRLTTGRPCLAAPVVRLLNLPAGIQPGSVSAAVAGNDAGDGGFASDTDVAQWARTCRDQYGTCRGYLGALRQFYEGADRE